MSPRYHHRKSRPLHEIRRGWFHYTQHRDGIRHRHSRHEKVERPERRSGRWRSVPRQVWPREIGRQVAVGAMIGAGVLILIALILGAISFFSARNDLSKAQAIGRGIVNDRNQLLTAYGRANAANTLADMHYYASQADSELSGSWSISLLKMIPIFGNQVTGMTDTVHGVNVLAGQGQALLDAANNAVGASHGTSINLPALKALDQQVHTSTLVLASQTRTAGGLWGPVRTEREKLNKELAVVVALLSRGGQALDFAQPFLGSNGPRTYLVAGQNNSEMRDQGAVLSWALLHVKNGTFTMDSAASVGTIALKSPAAPIVDPGTRVAFGALEPTRIWQSTNANGNFPVSSRWMIAMLAKARGVHVDGVVGVDVATLTNILHVTGPVRVPTIPGKIITSSNVAPLLLYKLYLLYPAGSQKARHDDVTAVAQAAVKKMEAGHYDLGAFLHSLARASQGRHLLFYDTNPKLEATVVRFGGAGGMRDMGNNAVHVAIEAGVAAKLDWFMHSSVTYDIRLDKQGTAYIDTTILLHNSAPANAAPSYALGPDHTNSFTPGEYIARVYQWLPAGSQAPGSITEEHLSLQRAVRKVYAQQTQEVIFTSIMLNAVHHGVFTLHFIPQSLIHPSLVTANFTSTNGFDGPVQSTWTGNHFVTLRWTASH